MDQPVCSLNNEEFFQIGLMDSPRVVGVQLVGRSCVEPGKQEVLPDWTRLEP